MKKRLISISLIVLLVISLASCSSEKYIHELKTRFEGFSADSNVIVVLNDSVFYFADHTLSLSDITDDEELNNGYLFWDGKLFFTTVKQNGGFDFSLCVYSCDLYGNNKQVVFEKNGYTTKPWVTGNQETLFVKHYTTSALDASSRNIDSYNVVSGEYQTKASGEDASLSDYQKNQHGRYSCTNENGVYSVYDPQTNVTYTIDTIALVHSAFGEELDGIDLINGHFFATDDGKMFLLYRIESNGLKYPHLLCEYLPDRNEVVFKNLCFADDIETFSVVYPK